MLHMILKVWGPPKVLKDLRLQIRTLIWAWWPESGIPVTREAQSGGWKAQRHPGQR
jgi:hypothetical protein